MAESDQIPSGPPKPRPWNDPRIRGIVFQVIILALVVWVGWMLVRNTMANMAVLGIGTGFGFLKEPADFGILMSLIPYDESMSYLRVFFVGLINTLVVSAIGIVLSTIVGFMVGIGRLSGNWLVRKLSLVYIEIFRNVPLLLQIFFWYFVVLRTLPSVRNSFSLGGLAFFNNRGLFVPNPHPLPGFHFVVIAFVLTIIGIVVWSRYVKARQNRTGHRLPSTWPCIIAFFAVPIIVFLILGQPLHWSLPTLKGFNFRGGASILPEFAALLAALTMYTSSFIAEAVRSGLQSVSKGQVEAARSLGLKPGRTLRLVVIPQAMRVIIPQLTSEYLNLTKNSSLATAIGYPDLVAVFMGTTLNQTGHAVEIVAMTMAVYLTISLLISMGMNIYNRAVAFDVGRSS